MSYLDELRKIDLNNSDAIMGFAIRLGDERDKALKREQDLEQSRNDLLDMLATGEGIHVYCGKPDVDSTEFDKVVRFKDREQFEEFCRKSFVRATKQGTVSIKVISKNQYEQFSASSRNSMTEVLAEQTV
tara:strand:- start:90 stop:479 length:390 start_codon:yes stop_codon:yes gene_type:complete